MSDHEFSDTDGRCVKCGTPKAHHERVAQPCPGRPEPASTLRPEPALRQMAIDDVNTIHARLGELKAEREAGWNKDDAG